jgi:hypothetical protein
MERRRFSRIPFQAPAEVTILDKSYDAKLLDLSLKGVLLFVEDSVVFEPNEKVMISIHLPQSSVVVSLEGSIVKQADQQWHCKVEHIELDSLSHIRRLIELNLADEALLERELEQFITPEL